MNINEGPNKRNYVYILEKWKALKVNTNPKLPRQETNKIYLSYSLKKTNESKNSSFTFNAFCTPSSQNRNKEKTNDKLRKFRSNLTI